MVELSPDVADQIEDLYDRETVEQYQEMAPEQVLEETDISYEDGSETLERLDPDHLEDMYEDAGLADALEELDDALETYREQTTEHLINVALRDEVDDIELE